MWAIFYPQEFAKWKGTLRNKEKNTITNLFFNNFGFEFVFRDVKKKKFMPLYLPC
jgi:hypothetical protein